MADRLARIFGTEEDKVNCPFYFKIGACRHGNRCSRQHVRPNFSQTILLPHLFNPPNGQAAIAQGPSGLSDVLSTEDQQFYNDFTDDILDELNKFGRVEELHVCQNLGDHMFGNVYIKFREEEDAEKSLVGIMGRCYAGQLIQAEYSPVTDFREARCRQYDEETCGRGGYCNFMHLKAVPPHLRGYLKSATRGSREGGFQGGGARGGQQDYRRQGPPQFDRRGPPPSRYRDDHRGDRGGGDHRGGGGDFRGDHARNSRDGARGGGGGGSDHRSGGDRRGRGYDSRHSDPEPPRRDNSEERRRQIAEWNMEKQ